MLMPGENSAPFLASPYAEAGVHRAHLLTEARKVPELIGMRQVPGKFDEISALHCCALLRPAAGSV